MKLKTILIACFLTYSVSACSLSSFVRGERDNTATTTRFGSALFIDGRCSQSGSVNELTSTVVAGIVSSVLDRGFAILQGILKSAAESKETVTSAISSDHFYLKTDNGPILLNKCLSFVESNFGAGDPTYDEHWDESTFSRYAEEHSILSPPNKYFELNLQLSDDGTAFKVAPGAFHYRKGDKYKKTVKKI